MAIRNLLLSTEAGLGNGETPIFPIQIFRVKEGVNYNPGEPNYDLFKLAMRCSAKRLFPNFSFQDAPFNLEYYKEGHPETEIAYMGCRTRVMANVHDPDKQISNGRGNLSFTTINLPRLAIKANHNVEQFFEGLDRMIDLCIDQLFERFEIQARKCVRNYPFLMGQGVWLDSEKLGLGRRGARSAQARHALHRLHRPCRDAQGAGGRAPRRKRDGAQPGPWRSSAYMRRRCDEASQKTGMNVTLLATPAEGLSGRFVKIDRRLFGEIPGVTDREYYTNSFHVPVYYDISAVEKIRIEAPYHALTNAGPHLLCGTGRRHHAEPRGL